MQARRSRGEVERPSRYLEKTNNGAGNLNREGRGREVQGHDTVLVKNKAGGAGRQGMYKDKGAMTKTKTVATPTPRARTAGGGRPVTPPGRVT